jgi:hypothetical protein
MRLVNEGLITAISAKGIVLSILMNLVGWIVAITITAELSKLLLLGPASGQDPLVGLLVLLFGGVKRFDGLTDIVLDPFITTLNLATVGPVVSVPARIEGSGHLIISEEHVLSVVVNKVALLLAQVKLSNEAGYSKLLNDLEDVKLLIEPGARLCLELVLGTVRVPAAQAPRTVEVLLTTESPHGVAERLAPVVYLGVEVGLEGTFVLGWFRVVMALLVLLLLYIVVKLLGHRVVKGEALVGTKDVSNEAQAEGQVRTESLESV